MSRRSGQVAVVIAAVVLAVGCGREAAAPRKVYTLDEWAKELETNVKPGMTAERVSRWLGDRWLDKQIFKLGDVGSFATIYLLEGGTVLNVTSVPDGEVTSYGLRLAEAGKQKITGEDALRFSDNTVVRVVRSDRGPEMPASLWHDLIKKAYTPASDELSTEGLLSGAYLDKRRFPDSGGTGYHVVYLMTGGAVVDTHFDLYGRLREYVVGPANDTSAKKLPDYTAWREFMKPDPNRPIVEFAPIGEPPPLPVPFRPRELPDEPRRK